MSVEICVYPPLSLEEINSDENLELKKDEQNEEWLYFKNNILTNTRTGFLIKDIDAIQEFVEYMWTKYKKLTGFDGWGQNGDGLFRLIMESSEYNENIKIEIKTIAIYSL